MSAARWGARCACLLTLATLSGCIGGITETTTARASEETLLLSTAAERAVLAYPAAHLAGTSVWVDESYFEVLDKGYVVSCLRQHLAEKGARLVEREAEADFVLEVRNGTLGINDPEWTVGIPSIPLAQFGQAVTLPRFAIGYDPQIAWAKFQFWTYDAATGETIDLSVAWGQSETGWFQSITPNVIGTIKAQTR